MDTLKNIFDQYGRIMDQDIIAVQLGCYSVALLGLSAAIRKVRPFSRFKRPKDIPKHFIEERRELIGTVKRIDPNGGLLMVDHKPLISLPIIPRGELPVRILGVKVSGLGISWLQAIVVDSQVTLIPIKKESNFIQCEVLLPNTKTIVRKMPTKKKSSLASKLLAKKEAPFLNIGESLVKIGFAEVIPVEPAIVEEANYFKTLQSANIYALKKKLGLKYYIEPSKKILEAIITKFANYSKRIVSNLFIKAQQVQPKITAT